MRGGARRLRAEGHDAVAVVANAGSKTDLEALVARTVDEYGRLDICVANAGMNPHYGSLMDAPGRCLRQDHGDPRLKAVWRLAQLARPHLVASRAGSFIVMSSIAGVRGTPVLGIYGISKAAETAIVRNLAVEWGPSNICVNAIAPGLDPAPSFPRALVGNYNPRQAREAGDAVAASRRAVRKSPAWRCFSRRRAARFVTGQVHRCRWRRHRRLIWRSKASRATGLWPQGSMKPVARSRASPRMRSVMVVPDRKRAP